MNSKVIGCIGVVLALLGILWTAATQWQGLQDRVKSLEEKQLFLHGDFHLPPKGS